jgi:hypothetical protein
LSVCSERATKHIEVTFMRATRKLLLLTAFCVLILPLLNSFSAIHTTPPIASALLPAPTVTPRILYFTQFSDNNPGGELENVWAAINATHGTGYSRTNLTDYMDLGTELPNHDILLIPEQEDIAGQNITDIAAAWPTPLTTFLADGGIIILMSYWSRGIGAGLGATAEILNETGHFTFIEVHDQTYVNVLIDEPTHPLADGVTTFLAPDGSISFNTTETTLVASAQSNGEGVVFHKPVGPGHLVVMGIDFFERNPEADEILTNAIRLYQPPAAPVLADPGATISGFQVPLNWTVPADTDGVIVEYEVQASSSNTFAIIGQSATVTTTNHAFIFLSNGTYFFRVRAIDNNTLAGPWSNVVSTYIELPDITFPPIPGFPIEAIAIGLLLSLSAIFVIRRRKQQQVSS